MDKTILILGGGIGGIVTARELRKHLGAQHRIVVVDKQAVHSFPPSFLWVMIGWRTPSAIQKPLVSLEKYDIEFHHASVCAIHPEKHTVETDTATLPYDYLVIALGAELAPETIPGYSSTGAHSFYSLDPATRLSQAISTFSGGTMAIVIASLPYKCPPAPYEAALLLESYYARRGSNNVKIKLFTPEPSPLMAAGPHAGEMLRSLMTSRNIQIETKHTLSSIESVDRRLIFENKQTSIYDFLIIVPPHRAPEIIRSSGLTNSSGWIPVNERTLRTQHTNIFALGDVTTIQRSNGFPLPKAGVFAHHQAEVVAHNIALDIHNCGTRKEFSGMGFCFLETGNGRAGYISGNFLAKPSPTVTFHEPNVTYHWGKVMFEKFWLWKWI